MAVYKKNFSDAIYVPFSTLVADRRQRKIGIVSREVRVRFLRVEGDASSWISLQNQSQKLAHFILVRRNVQDIVHVAYHQLVFHDRQGHLVLQSPHIQLKEEGRQWTTLRNASKKGEPNVFLDRAEHCSLRHEINVFECSFKVYDGWLEVLILFCEQKIIA